MGVVAHMGRHGHVLHQVHLMAQPFEEPGEPRLPGRIIRLGQSIKIDVPQGAPALIALGPAEKRPALLAGVLGPYQRRFACSHITQPSVPNRMVEVILKSSQPGGQRRCGILFFGTVL